MSGLTRKILLEQQETVYLKVKNVFAKRVKCALMCAVVICTAVFAASCGRTDVVNEDGSAVVSHMTLDEKLSQMIIPAIRTWNGDEVTDLDEVPDLREALKKHQYGGIILFGQNIKNTEQTVRLVSGLQANNLSNEAVSVHIPYLMPLDEEGGIVIRLTDGTRMTGNMAIGATGDAAEKNALVTGRIIGEELSALGFNADFAPVVDVNNNAANPVIGVRSFSDDPKTVAELGTGYMDGLAGVNIAAACKHFPGHGDTDVDSHIGTPTVEKTYEELLQTELVPFEAMTGHGVDMVMTAHITFPKIDDKVTYGDGTEGYYPATMSKKIITDILRGDLGYDGVVVTDALEMDAIMNAALVDGEPQSTEYMVNVAEKVINAGADILLIPKDLCDAESAAFYDGYISGLEAKVEDGIIPMERIDESVGRILKLKEKYGIEESAYSDNNIDELVENAKSVVGSEEHHKVEMEIARSAITVLKNDGNTLPLSKDIDRVFLLCRAETDRVLVESTMSALKEEGVIDPDTEVLFDYYIESDSEGEKLHYSEGMADGIRNADVVIGMTQTYNSAVLAESAPMYQALSKAINDVHEGGGRFVLLSCRLPYDAARFLDADAVVLAYLGAGMDMDPTAAGSSTGTGAYNANAVAAIEVIAGKTAPSGRLPVNIPEININSDGTVSYGDGLLYKRGDS